MLLTSNEIQMILDIIGREVVVEDGPSFPFKVTTAYARGYHSDPALARIQAKLSIMGEVAARLERP